MKRVPETIFEFSRGAQVGQYLTFAMPSQIDNNPAIPIADEL
ncbi:hypothetical protein P3T24_006313 [Paraburkholderia sp. GAS33]|jgi:hypothetical protein